MDDLEKPLVWLYGQVKTPPFSIEIRRRAGFLLRLLQSGATLSMPVSRPMPAIGNRCHELRLRDSPQSVIWRIVYRIDSDAIIIGDVFVKKTQKMPLKVIDACKLRF